MTAFKRASELQALSPAFVAFLGLLLILCLQGSGLFIFVKGFLLSRVALSDAASNQASNTIAARYCRAVILVIDALRYDFVFPSEQSVEHYQNVLKLPAHLSAQSPENSRLYKFIADPPTTTLQRLKALTVGTLPTFVDAGSNFAGSSIDEDNWLAQAQRAGKKIAFTGDDTWMSLFPLASTGLNASAHLTEGLSWPFDSFNVEDLDTVDNGVRAHLLPLLEDDPATPSWDILIGHMLGVDHVGHRVGPSHPEMHRKLAELQDLLEIIVSKLRNDDLLIVMGDHGMDPNGNHGGDAEDEVSAALWLYSKTPLVNAKAWASVVEDLQKTVPNLFWSDNLGSHRVVQQISLVPTLSLLLGLPIPFSNLGSIIPEIFAANDLARALKLNVNQLHNFLQAYLSRSADEKLADRKHEFEALYTAATADSATVGTRFAYLDLVLEASRASWATFDATLMSIGVLLLFASICVLASFARLSSHEGVLHRNGIMRLRIGKAFIGAAIGGFAGIFAASLMPLSMNTAVLGSASASASIAYFLPLPSKTYAWTRISRSSLVYTAVPLIHGLSFASNSFVLWEDQAVVYMCQLIGLWQLCKAFTSPQARLRSRIFLFQTTSLVAVKFASLSTICREEQQPNCVATFHLPNTLSGYPIAMLTLLLIVCFAMPSVIARILDQTQSRQGVSSAFLAIGLRGCLLGAALYSLVDFLLTTLDFSSETQQSFVSLKNTTAITVYGNVIVGLGLIWHLLSDINIDIRRNEIGQSRVQVELIGFANCLGSTYLLAFAGVLALIMMVNRPVGQLALSALFVALLGILEANDSIRDSDEVKQQLVLTASGKTPLNQKMLKPPTLAEIVPIALLGFVGFFATGHQAVLSSIQWKTAFVGFATVVYPVSPILVVLNTLGPFILTAVAVPLTAIWNVSPSIKDGPSKPLIRHTFRACVLFLLYHSLVAVPTAVFAAWHRRHLMVWKVFAPRFMTSAITLLAVDAVICFVAFGWFSVSVLNKSSRQLGSRFS